MIKAWLLRINGDEEPEDRVEIDGVKIIPISEGIGINLKNITQIAWEIEKCVMKK